MWKLNYTRKLLLGKPRNDFETIRSDVCVASQFTLLKKYNSEVPIAERRRKETETRR